MTQKPQGQALLPASIQLFRYHPTRRAFAFDALDPARVTKAKDLPPYLVLGPLDESSFRASAAGWSASWRGAKRDTFLQIDYCQKHQAMQVSMGGAAELATTTWLSGSRRDWDDLPGLLLPWSGGTLESLLRSSGSDASIPATADRNSDPQVDRPVPPALARRGPRPNGEDCCPE